MLNRDERFLPHGDSATVPLVSAAVNRVVPLEKLARISFGHLEAYECGRDGTSS